MIPGGQENFQKMKKVIMLAVILVLVTAAFYGGMKYAQSKTPSDAGYARQFGQGMGQGRMGRGMNDGFTAGDIIAKDDKSITIKMRDGSTKIVFYSGSTEVGKFVSGAVSDLSVGKTISVMGSANSDGSVNAQSIQIRPAFSSPSPTPNK